MCRSRSGRKHLCDPAVKPTAVHVIMTAAHAQRTEVFHFSSGSSTLHISLLSCTFGFDELPRGFALIDFGIDYNTLYWL